MPRISAEEVASPNVLAFLDTIAWSEIGPEILSDPASDDGYRVLVGSQPGQILTFSSYADHPHALLDVDGKPGGLESNAAGRYQILFRWWAAYKPILKLPDFSPVSQDRYAIEQLKETTALERLLAGDFDGAVGKAAHIWASLAGSPYGQHTNSMESLKNVFRAHGGINA